MQTSYTKKEVSEITGLPYRNVQFYTEQGVVVPEIEQAGGRGKFRRYSNRNLVSFIIAGELAYYGMTISEIRIVVLSLFHFWSLLHKTNIETGKTIKTVTDEGLIEILSNTVFEIRIGKTKEKAKVIEARLGADRKGNPLAVFSIVMKNDGSKILHLRANPGGKPYTVVMNENREEITGFDLEEFLKNGLVSFIFIGVDGLIRDAVKKIG